MDVFQDFTKKSFYFSFIFFNNFQIIHDSIAFEVLKGIHKTIPRFNMAPSSTIPYFLYDMGRSEFFGWQEVFVIFDEKYLNMGKTFFIGTKVKVLIATLMRKSFLFSMSDNEADDKNRTAGTFHPAHQAIFPA